VQRIGGRCWRKTSANTKRQRRRVSPCVDMKVDKEIQKTVFPLTLLRGERGAIERLAKNLTTTKRNGDEKKREHGGRIWK
jgi:hypothetical protein